MTDHNKKIRGIIPPIITPLKSQDELDFAGLERLIEHILNGGVHGLFVLGTTGEAQGLSYRLRMELIERVCRQVNRRVPVFVGITDTAFVESVNLARFSEKAGAQALVLAPPYYFPAGQAELLEYLQHLVPQLPLPLMLYNMPSHTKLMYEPDTVYKAAEIPGVMGLKDSSANMVYFHRLQLLLKNHPDFSLLIGPEELLGETVLLGGHGGVCGGANLFPELYVRLYEAAATGERARVEILHDVVMRISASIYSNGKYGSSFLKGIKCSLALENICNDFIAEPFHRFKGPDQLRIAKHLEMLKPIINEVLNK